MGKKEIDRWERAYKHCERKIRRNEEVDCKQEIMNGNNE